MYLRTCEESQRIGPDLKITNLRRGLWSMLIKWIKHKMMLLSPDGNNSIPGSSEGSRMATFTTFLDHEIIKSSQKMTVIQKSLAEEELRNAMDNVKMQLPENNNKKKNCHLMETLSSVIFSVAAQEEGGGLNYQTRAEIIQSWIQDGVQQTLRGIQVTKTLSALETNLLMRNSKSGNHKRF